MILSLQKLQNRAIVELDIEREREREQNAILKWKYFLKSDFCRVISAKFPIIANLIIQETTRCT